MSLQGIQTPNSSGLKVIRLPAPDTAATSTSTADTTDESLELRVSRLERTEGVKTILAPRRQAFKAMIAKKKVFGKRGGLFK